MSELHKTSTIILKTKNPHNFHPDKVVDLTADSSEGETEIDEEMLPF